MITEKKELIEYLENELELQQEDKEYCSIFLSSELDLNNNDPLLKNKYCIFFDQEYVTVPIPARFEPIDNKFNSLVEGYLGY